MRKYISCDDLLDAILSLPAKMDEDGYGWLGRRGVWQMVSDFPASDVVPLSDFKDCRNELCLKCGQYKTAHLGSCDGCRWKERGNG